AQVTEPTSAESGMRPRTSAAASASAVNPGPSVPTINASLVEGGAVENSLSVTDGSRGVSAAIVKPWARSWARPSGHFSIRANGTLNVAAIDVRMALRYSGSQQVGLRSTASEENPAAFC